MVPFLTIAKKTQTPREKYENTPQMHHLKFFLAYNHLSQKNFNGDSPCCSAPGPHFPYLNCY